jgi:hypothetical protein
VLEAAHARKIKLPSASNLAGNAQTRSQNAIYGNLHAVVGTEKHPLSIPSAHGSSPNDNLDFRDVSPSQTQMAGACTSAGETSLDQILNDGWLSARLSTSTQTQRGIDDFDVLLAPVVSGSLTPRPVCQPELSLMKPTATTLLASLCPKNQLTSVQPGHHGSIYHQNGAQYLHCVLSTGLIRCITPYQATTVGT